MKICKVRREFRSMTNVRSLSYFSQSMSKEENVIDDQISVFVSSESISYRMYVCLLDVYSWRLMLLFNRLSYLRLTVEERNFKMIFLLLFPFWSNRFQSPFIKRMQQVVLISRVSLIDRVCSHILLLGDYWHKRKTQVMRTDV